MFLHIALFCRRTGAPGRCAGNTRFMIGKSVRDPWPLAWFIKHRAFVYCTACYVNSHLHSRHVKWERWEVPVFAYRRRHAMPRFSAFYPLWVNFCHSLRTLWQKHAEYRDVRPVFVLIKLLSNWTPVYITQASLLDVGSAVHKLRLERRKVSLHALSAHAPLRAGGQRHGSSKQAKRRTCGLSCLNPLSRGLGLGWRSWVIPVKAFCCTVALQLRSAVPLSSLQLCSSCKDYIVLRSQTEG